MTPRIVLLPSKRFRDLASISARDPETVFLMAPDWGSVSERATWKKVAAARSGAVFSLPLRVGRLIAIFGARPGFIISNDDLVELVWGDDPDGGPEFAIGSISAGLSLHRAALRRLGLQIHGIHRGWRMDAVPVVPFAEAAE